MNFTVFVHVNAILFPLNQWFIAETPSSLSNLRVIRRGERTNKAWLSRFQSTVFSGKLRFQDGTKAKASVQTVAFEFTSDVSFKDSMVLVGKTR